MGVERKSLEFLTISQAEEKLASEYQEEVVSARKLYEQNIKDLHGVYQACAVLHGLGIDDAIPNTWYLTGKVIEVKREQLPLVRKALGSRFRVTAKTPVDSTVKRGRPRNEMWIHLEPLDYPMLSIKYKVKAAPGVKCRLKTVVHKTRQVVCE